MNKYEQLISIIINGTYNEKMDLIDSLIVESINLEEVLKSLEKINE